MPSSTAPTVFGAIVQRPALPAVDDRALTQTMGHIHRVADSRLAAPRCASHSPQPEPLQIFTHEGALS
jgi:hypothetical protein